MPQSNNIKLSVIIPTLNEANNVENLIEYLSDNTKNDAVEIIIADAKSTDQTAEIAKNCGVKVLVTEKASRAHQMNEGAKVANGTILYFVHADVKPPKSFFEDITKNIDEGGILGCYRFKFDSRHPLLYINSFFTRFRFLWCRGGDQTMFIKRTVFETENGFDENFVVMEDFELIKRLWKKYQFSVLPKSVIVSARKYDVNNYFSVNLANLKIFNMFQKGVDPKILKTAYYRLIKHPKDI